MMGWSDRVSWICSKTCRENDGLVRSGFLDLFHCRPPEQSIRSAAGRVRLAAAGGSVPAGPWTALGWGTSNVCPQDRGKEENIIVNDSLTHYTNSFGCVCVFWIYSYGLTLFIFECINTLFNKVLFDINHCLQGIR